MLIGSAIRSVCHQIHSPDTFLHLQTIRLARTGKRFSICEPRIGSRIVQIALDEARGLQSHHFMPAASAIAWYLRSRRSSTSSAKTSGVSSGIASCQS